MARQTDSVMQRLQVGLVGLLVVLLFVSIANMLIDRADSPGKPVGPAQSNNSGVTSDSQTPPNASILEIGVTPVVPEKPSGKTPPVADTKAVPPPAVP
jgi:hypothetical protein